jgi:hypothetical protein
MSLSEVEKVVVRVVEEIRTNYALEIVKQAFEETGWGADQFLLEQHVFDALDYIDAAELNDKGETLGDVFGGEKRFAYYLFKLGVERLALTTSELEMVEAILDSRIGVIDEQVATKIIQRAMSSHKDLLALGEIKEETLFDATVVYLKNLVNDWDGDPNNTGLMTFGAMNAILDGDAGFLDVFEVELGDQTAGHFADVSEDIQDITFERHSGG